jgi:hypothetical protein
MKIFLLAFIGIFSFLSNSISNGTPGERNTNSSHEINSDVDHNKILVENLYTECELTDKLDYSVFKQGWMATAQLTWQIKITFDNRLLKPSTKKIFYY